METHIDKTQPLGWPSHEHQASPDSILEQCYWATVKAVRRQIEARPEVDYQEAVTQQQEPLSIKENPQYKYILNVADTKRLREYMHQFGVSYEQVEQQDTYYLISDTEPSFQTEALLLRRECALDDEGSNGYEKLIYKSQPNGVKDGSHTRTAVETKVNLPQAPKLVGGVLLDQIDQQQLGDELDPFEIKKTRTRCITSILAGDSEISPEIHLDEYLSINGQPVPNCSFLEISLPEADKPRAEEFLSKELDLWTTEPIGVPYIDQDFAEKARASLESRAGHLAYKQEQASPTKNPEQKPLTGCLEVVKIDANGDFVTSELPKSLSAKDATTLCELLVNLAKPESDRSNTGSLKYTTGSIKLYSKCEAGAYLLPAQSGVNPNRAFKSKTKNWPDKKTQRFAKLCKKSVYHYKTDSVAGNSGRLHFTIYEPEDRSGIYLLPFLHTHQHDKADEQLSEQLSQWVAPDALNKAANGS